MKLEKFMVTNFRSVKDSGWINASDVTALIGENEAGKTNLLLPLWKLNPAGDGGEINLLNDMPKSRFAEMRSEPASYTFIRCHFILNDEERDLAEEFGVDRSKTERVEVWKTYKGGVGIEFPNYDFDTLKAKISGTEEDADAPTLWRALINRLPKFVYYSNYGNLGDQIYLPHVVHNLSRKDELSTREAAKARTLKVLFDLVDLGPEEMLELAESTGVTKRFNHQGQIIHSEDKTQEKIDEDDESLRTRAALLQSASSKLTREFVDWWKQGKYKFRLHADGYYFRIYVSDNRREDEIELENRSTGLQWFLSFFLVFTFESSGDHEDAVVLLDEPGRSLHPLAQRDLSTFFENLSGSHQIIYTTHSPFLIDADRLDRVRKVYIDDEGRTVASEDLGTRSHRGSSPGATYAVYSALNLSVSESLLLGCKPVIVEGPSDQHYLSAMKTLLIQKGKIKPKAELVFPPSGGAKTAKIIASILVGRDDTLPHVLLDSDDAGTQAAKSLRDGLYNDEKDFVLNTDDFIVGMTKTEIEDFIPTQVVVQVMDRMERRANTDFEDFHTPGKPIIPQIKAWAENEGFELPYGWKVDLSIGVKNKLLANPAKAPLDEETLKVWTDLFKAFL